VAYRNILVSLGIDPLSDNRLDAAVALATAHKARLVGCFTSIWSDVWFRDRHVVTLERAEAVLDEVAERTKATFDTTCVANQVRGTFRRDRKHALKTDIVAAAALSADLCVLSCGEKAGLDEGDIFETLPEALIFAASCPVLLVPEDKRRSLGRNVLVAWKARREAARALRDALPMLHAAEQVTVLSVGDGDSVRDAVDFLEAHQIRAKLIIDPSPDAAAGDAILSQAQRLGCDMLIMGAYGHTRIRELVLGGVTRHVLINAGIPLLLSH